MLSTSDLERLIAVKRLEIEKEKTQLGLLPPRETPIREDDKENGGAQRKFTKQVTFTQNRALCERNDVITEKKEKDSERASHQELDDTITPDLDRYIRRYLGLPVMLKAGEYSPNNPLIRGERAAGDVLLGLGEYERQRNTLRRIRQQQYREYLDQQAKKKQEAKEEAERERREREEREKAREERERELLLERDSRSPQRRRVSVDHTPVTATVYCNNKVDTAVQVDGFTRPLSVAVQTDDAELFTVAEVQTGSVTNKHNMILQLSPSSTKSLLTEAERELSPRTVVEAGEKWRDSQPWQASPAERRRSYGDFDERSSTLIKKCNRDKLSTDLRHSYMPSIFDADAIRLRNQQAEKEAAERRQYYQRELKNQILEQQRIREERKNREKMLEQAEMRRLEEQLRMLRLAQEHELSKHHEMTATMKENATEYNSKRTELQREIDAEQQKLYRSAAQQPRNTTKRTPTRSDYPSKLPFHYPKPTSPKHTENKKPYSINIPDSSIFSSNYDVDSYLRRNLNFNKGKVRENDFENTESATTHAKDLKNISSDNITNKKGCNNINSEVVTLRNGTTGKDLNNIDAEAISLRKDLNHIDNARTTRRYFNDIDNAAITQRDFNNVDNPATPLRDLNNIDSESVTQRKDLNNIAGDSKTVKNISNRPIEKYTTSDNNELPIPVLKHTPTSSDEANNNRLSDKMKIVNDKWRVPAVQKNILRSLPNDEGKNVSILTQLGSIRRQLQLEQMKLDRMSDSGDC